MLSGDYDELANRVIDAPFDREAWEALLVCSDALAQRGDPRGPLIAFEHALHTATGERALTLTRETYHHTLAHADQLIGSELAPLVATRRVLAIDWRAGQVFGVAIDARHATAKLAQPPRALVERIVAAPALRTMRRLRIRTPRDTVDEITNLIRSLPTKLALEELEVSPAPWPDRVLGEQATLLTSAFPHLYLVVVGDAVSGPPATSPAEIATCGPPTAPEARALVGRALLSNNPERRAAALDSIPKWGAHGRVFERLFRVLLHTRRLECARQVVGALGALAPSPTILHELERVASQSDRYDEATRKAAGASCRAMRARVPELWGRPESNRRPLE